MSRQYQNPNYHSGHSQTPYPYPTPSQQSGQVTQPIPITRDNHSGHSSRQAYSSYPAEGSLQPQPSGQRYGSHSPYAGPVPIPGPQGSPVGHPQTYLTPSLATPNLPVGTHPQERRGSYGYPPSTGSPSDSHQFYASGASDTSGGSKFYSRPEVHRPGGYAAADTRPQDWDAGEYDEEQDWDSDEVHDPRTKGRMDSPVGTNRLKPLCRLPYCNDHVFFDRRVNELREWCSEEHMEAAIAQRVEKPCRTCGKWPRRNGYKFCSKDGCRYPGFPPSLTTPNLTVGAHQQGRQASYGHPPPTGSSSDGHRFYPVGGSDAGGGSNFYPHPGVQSHPGGDYAVREALPQNRSGVGYNEGRQGHGPQSRAPGNQPVGSHKPRCRYPGCSYQVYFDRRVNRLSEWCGDEHIRAATADGVEKRCKECHVWPRRKNYRFCGGDVCIYPHRV